MDFGFLDYFSVGKMVKCTITNPIRNYAQHVGEGFLMARDMDTSHASSFSLFSLPKLNSKRFHFRYIGKVISNAAYLLTSLGNWSYTIVIQQKECLLRLKSPLTVFPTLPALVAC